MYPGAKSIPLSEEFDLLAILFCSFIIRHCEFGDFGWHGLIFYFFAVLVERIGKKWGIITGRR